MLIDDEKLEQHQVMLAEKLANAAYTIAHDYIQGQLDLIYKIQMGELS